MSRRTVQGVNSRTVHKVTTGPCARAQTALGTSGPLAERGVWWAGAALQRQGRATESRAVWSTSLHRERHRWMRLESVSGKCGRQPWRQGHQPVTAAEWRQPHVLLHTAAAEGDPDLPASNGQEAAYKGPQGFPVTSLPSAQDASLMQGHRGQRLKGSQSLKRPKGHRIADAYAPARAAEHIPVVPRTRGPREADRAWWTLLGS